MNIDEKLKIQYDKFFVKMNEFKTTEVKDWTSNHILGYYCQKYKDYYKLDYQFKYDKSPSQSYELKMIGVVKLIVSADPVIMKDYIDFYFERRVKTSKKRLMISSLRAEFLLTEFKETYQIKQSEETTISRSVQLPNNILGIMIRNKLPVRTYGDLVFLLNSNEYDNIKVQLDEISFDYTSILDRVV